MTTAHDPREKELFLEALELPAHERAGWLARECGSEPTLQRRVEELLALEADAPQRFLRGESQGDLPPVAPGTKLAGFELVRVIGEGGMGTVFEARQSSPRREVALKVIRQGRATRDAVRRFRHEAQVLASLQHPGIAQVYDAGSARLGESDVELPWFSMELVRGKPLLAFVEERGLDRRARLELVARIADAVHHAHQRGIIHRDLKSDNVIVVEEESTALEAPAGVGQPKVVDFGVARVIGSEGERTLETRAGDLIGTLSTMSPEQVAGDGGNVGVRSDVYALGVMLHQVLTGGLPLALEGLSVAQAIERIRHTDPERISLHDTALRGDLEVLVARTLEKDPDRRVQSAAELAADLRRHLAGEAILARADSALYVFGKLLRRHWALTATLATALLALVAVAIVSSVHSTRNRRLSARLADELEVSNVERGRLYTEQDDFRQAADLLWPVFLEQPDSRYARWSLWELYSRTPSLGTWATHEDFVGEVAIHPDGETLVSVGRDGRLFLVQAGEARVIDRVDHDRHAVTFDADGDLLAVSEDDGLTTLYEVPAFRVRHELRASAESARYARFLPDGRLVTAGSLGEVRVWNPETGALLDEWSGHEDSVLCIAVSSDGSRVATSGYDPFVLLWPADGSGAPQRIEADHTRLEALAFSADDRLLATGGRDKRIRLFELPAGRLVADLPGANGFVEDLEFHPLQPNVLVSGGWWGTLFWDVEERVLLDRVGIGSQSLVFHPSGLLATHYGRDVRLLDATGGGSERLGGHTERVACEASPVGSRVATADEIGLVQLFDAESAELLQAFRVDPARVRALSFDAAGERLAVGCGSGRARVFALAAPDAEAAELLVLEEHTEVSAQSVCLSPDGRLVAHTSDRAVRVFEVDTGVLLLDLTVDENQALGVAFHPDGDRFATTSRKANAVRLWNLAGELLWEQGSEDFDATPWTTAFSPDGRRLAFGSWDKSLHVLDARTGAVEVVLPDHRAVLWDVAFHPTDPDLVASASDDGTIKLWDLDERRRLATLKDYGDWEALGVSFLPDGDTFVTAGRHGAVLRSLSYFDRHVAANVPYFLERYASDPELDVAHAALERWAAEVLARPWPPVRW